LDRFQQQQLEQQEQKQVWKIEKSGDKLEFDQNINDYGTITSDEMSTMLSGGSITNEKGTFSYDEYIDLADNANVTFAVDPDDDTDTPAWYMKFASASPAYTYKLSFSNALESDYDTSAPTKHLEDIEMKTIKILGKDYTITKAITDGTKSVELTLMSGAVESTQNEYTTQTYTVNGKTYEVEVVSIGQSASTGGLVANLNINGEALRDLQVNDVKTLSDGTTIGIKYLLENEGSEAQGADQVTFYIGADKIVLSDSDVENADFGGTEYKVGESDVDNTDVKITGDIDSGVAKISSIEVKYTPDDDLYIPVDGKLSDKLEDANALFTKTFDYQFTGLSTENTETIKIYKSNDDEYKLKYTAKDGETFDGELFVYNDSDTDGEETTDVYLGYISGGTYYPFHIDETDNIGDEELFVVTAGDYSHIFQFKDLDTGDEIIKLKDLNSGETMEISYDVANTPDATLYFHGYAIGINVNTGAGTITVDMNNSGTIGDNTDVHILTGYGATIDFDGFGAAADDSDVVKIITEEHEDGATTDTVALAFTRNNVSHYVDVDYSSGLDLGPYTIGDSNKEEGYTTYGLHLLNDYTNDQNTITIDYPDNQVFANVYVTGEKVSTTTTTTGPVTVNYVDVTGGISRVDTDFDTTTPDKNVILIGGPSVNKLVYNLAEAGLTDKAADYAPDTAIVQLIEDAYGTNDALIIAGYAAKDTQLAGKVVSARLLQGQFADKLTGDKVVINTAAGTLSGVEFE